MHYYSGRGGAIAHAHARKLTPVEQSACARLIIMAFSFLTKILRRCNANGLHTARRKLSNVSRKAEKGLDQLSRHYDVVVVGGGVMGSSSAYFLASRMPNKSVCVVERDFTVSLP